MEGLDVSKLPIDLLLNILNIVILFLITRFLVYKPVKKFMAQRREKVEKEKSDAKQQMQEALSLKEEYEKKLTEAQSNARESLLESEKKAQERKAQIISEAQKEAQEIKAEAKAEALKEKDEALNSLKDDVASLAVQISEKILSREITDRDNERIVENFFKDGKAE